MRDDIVKLTPAALDRILGVLFGSWELCPGCGGEGTLTEWVKAVDGRYVPLFGVPCYHCSPNHRRGFTHIVTEED